MPACFHRFGALPVVITAFLAALTGLAALPGQARAQAQAALDQSPAGPVVDALVAEGMARAGVPGLVAVVVQDGRIAFAKGYGLADVARRIPMTPQTNLRAGSVSKPISAAAIMRLIQDGRLALDAPIDRYLPGVVRPDGYGRASTVAQLLTMTGGYTDDVLQVHAPTTAEFEPLCDFVQRRVSSRQVQPGVMVYSSWNLGLLGCAVERITGRRYDEVVADAVFAPLGMRNSSFRQPLPPAIAANLAAGYFVHGERTTVVPNDLVPLSPGIGLVTTGEDLGRFMAALLPAPGAPGSPILNDDALRAVLTRQATVHPLLRGRTYGFSDAPFGPPGTIYHDGNGIGFGSRMVLVPQRRLGIFVGINHRALGPSLNPTPAFGFARGLAVKLLERFDPEPAAARAPMSPVPNPNDGLARFAGQYQAAGSPRHNLMKLGMLFDYANVSANTDGTLTIGALRYARVQPALFQSLKYPDTLAAFLDDERGQVRYLSFGGTGAYERVPWYGRLDVHAGAGLACALVSLAYVCVWPFRRRGSWLPWALALVNLGFFIGWGLLLAFGDLLVLFKTIPWAMRLVLALPWIGIVLGAWQLTRPWTAGKVGVAARLERWAPRLVAVAAIPILGLAVYWRLFPW
jgi:CubicO group peptidase (beta-lactamase class C family)